MGHGNQTTVAEPREGAQAAKAQDAAEVKQKVAPALAEAARDPARQDAIPPAFRLLMSKLVSGALDTAVRLGLPDLMKDGRPHSVDDLAAACGAQPELLNRLMRCLCNDDVFVENESRVFSLGEAGQFFRTDHPMSVTEFSHLFCGEALATHWDCLYDRVKEGKTCNAKLYGGLPLLEFWMKPKNFPQFKRFHDNLSRLSVPGIVHAYRNEWRKYNVICDVCGANDFLLAEVLKNGNPHARGILFDDPPIAEMAKATQQQLGVADRVDCIGGDVFEAVPRADLFMIKQTVHPWNDEMVVKMLKNCRESLNRGGKILIMEAVLSDQPNVPEFNRYIDMLHMLHSDGRERTENEFRSVCAQAGLRIVRVFKPMGILPFIECEPLQA